ncbi:Phospholipid-transporting ATPase [Temnothorax longispinosus]|uniref:Phospholipid-transporting ATPase n=1 Tax=Temnothorax longispinosus TaxID=300112 RepID=A0A4S2JBF8_9HYME|nr:Phospholipid-transporting ATPase [Temnothorax longispinosus]
MLKAFSPGARTPPPESVSRWSYHINELRPLLLRMLRDADGFAFSQEEGGSVTQTDVIRAYDTNLPKPGGM